MTNAPEFQLSEEQAWQVVSVCTTEIASLKLEGLTAIAVIGSLPGGYYRPGQSDLDLVLLFSSFPNLTDLEAMLANAISAGLKKNVPDPSLVDLEAYPRLEAEILPNPETGRIPRPDLAARLQTQGKVLWGNLPMASLRMPTALEWTAEMDQFIDYWEMKNPQGSEVPPRAAVGFVLSLMRLFLATTGLVEYDKRRLLGVFSANAEEVQLPPIIPEVLNLSLAGQPLSQGQYATFLGSLPDFQAKIRALLP